MGLCVSSDDGSGTSYNQLVQRLATLENRCNKLELQNSRLMASEEKYNLRKKLEKDYCAKADAIFDACDLDKNGELTKQELSNFIKSNYQFQEMLRKRDAFVAKRVAQEEKNEEAKASGKVPPAPPLAEVQEEMEKNFINRAEALIKSLDGNTDGVLTRDEFRKLFGATGRQQLADSMNKLERAKVQRALVESDIKEQAKVWFGMACKDKNSITKEQLKEFLNKNYKFRELVQNASQAGEEKSNADPNAPPSLEELKQSADKHLAQIVKQFDQDKNSTIELEEFVSMCEQFSKGK